MIIFLYFSYQFTGRNYVLLEIQTQFTEHTQMIKHIQNSIFLDHTQLSSVSRTRQKFIWVFKLTFYIFPHSSRSPTGYSPSLISDLPVSLISVVLDLIHISFRYFTKHYLRSHQLFDKYLFIALRSTEMGSHLQSKGLYIISLLLQFLIEYS